MARRSDKTAKIYSKRAKSVKRLRKRLIISAVTVFMICALCGAFGNSLISSAEEGCAPADKYYTSITVYPGDTLWSIAEEYITDDCGSIPEYISVLKEINSLDSDEIKAWNNLIVVYDHRDIN